MNYKTDTSLLLKLQEGLQALNLVLPEETEVKLIHYIELLHKWNAIHNLTAVKEPEEMLKRHILDSLVLFPFLERKPVKKIIDVGTGAGLPGIVLALCFPTISFTLLDSQQKKINFVQHVILSLKIENASPICQRVETYKPSFGFDWVISRAYASLSHFAISASHLLSPDGLLVAMKGQISQEEIKALPETYFIESSETLLVPGLSAHRCVIFLKRKQ